MTASGDQQPLFAGGNDRRAEVNSRNRPAGPLAVPDLIDVERDHERRLTGLFLDPPGDNADHAGMPAATGQDQDGAVVLCFDLQLGSFLNRSFDGTALVVEAGKLFSDRSRLVAGTSSRTRPSRSWWRDARPGRRAQHERYRRTRISTRAPTARA